MNKQLNYIYIFKFKYFNENKNKVMCYKRRHLSIVKIHTLR